MYSNKRSFEILEFEFWLYDQVMEPEDYDKLRQTAPVLTDLSDDGNGDYVFDVNCPTLLRPKT